VLRRDCSEIRADLMVRTGDHCEESVSKQIAPCWISLRKLSLDWWSYCLGADIGVPDLGLKAHDGWSERVFTRDLDVDCECTALVRCVWRPVELTAQMCEVIAVSRGLNKYLGELVILDIGNLLSDTPGSVRGSHCERYWS
jgi:hypothetical protein